MFMNFSLNIICKFSWFLRILSKFKIQTYNINAYIVEEKLITFTVLKDDYRHK